MIWAPDICSLSSSALVARYHMNRYGWRLPISIRRVIRVTGSIMCAHKTAKDLRMDYLWLSQKQVDRITQYRILRDSCIALIPKQKLLSIAAAGARGGVITCV